MSVHVLMLKEPAPADRIRVDVQGLRKVVPVGEKQYVSPDVADRMLALSYRGRGLFQRIEILETEGG